MGIIASLLAEDGRDSIYTKAFANTELPSIESIKQLLQKDRNKPPLRHIRKIQIFWAILKVAGFPIMESRLNALGINSKGSVFNPRFNAEVRKKIHNTDNPKDVSNIEELIEELKLLIEYERGNTNKLKSSTKSKKDDDTEDKQETSKSLLDSDDLNLLNFLFPKQHGAGPTTLKPYVKYHDSNASKFIDEILKLLEEGKTVILDLGNANDKIRKFFSDMLSTAVFKKQEEKFVSDKLENHYVQLYFEEAHNLFPPDNKEFTGIYTRFAKEGAKFHVGMVYSTQSPSTINKELLIQTENFFVGHLSSQDETKALSRLQIAYQGIEEDILKARTPGFMRMLTRSHRFVIPVQANKFEAKQK